jgi:CRISPR/Cas system-associated endonuclease Cas1
MDAAETKAPLKVVKRRSPLSSEDRALFLSMVNELSGEKQPETARERALVEDIALNYIRLQRARQLETETLNKYIADGKSLALAFIEHGQELEKMQRKEVKIENAWYRAMRELDREQAARKKRALDPGSRGIHLVRGQ